MIQKTPAPSPASEPGPSLFGKKTVAGNLKRAAVRSWAVNATTQVAKFMINVGSSAVIARLLTPTDYGLVAMVTAFLSFISLFKDLGLSQATIQRETITAEQVTGLFWFNVAMGLAVMVVIGLSAPLVSRFYGHPELTLICLAYAVMAPIGSLGGQHNALLQRSMQYKSLAIRDLVSTCAGAAAGIISALMGCRYWSLVIMQAVGQVLGTATLWWKSGWRPGPPRWSPELKPLIRFGSTVTVSNILGFVMSGLDSVLIGYTSGATALGVYNRAQNTLSRPLRQILPPIMNVASSVFARAANDRERFERAALQLIFLVACVSSLLVAIAVSCTDWMVHALLGGQWGDAVPISRVLALFAFIEPVASLLGTLMNARGVPGKMVRWRMFSSVVIVVGLVAGLPWGPLGVATTYSLSGFFIRTPLFIWYSAKSIGMSQAGIYKSAGIPALCGALMAGFLACSRILIGAPANFVVAFALYSLAGCILFVALLLAFRAGRTRIQESVAMVKVGFQNKPKP